MASPPFSNRFTWNPPEGFLDQVLGTVRSLQTELAPELVDLRPDELNALPKMGPKTVDFVTKALELVQANPALRPSFLDVDEFVRDLAAVSQLRAILAPLQQIVSLLEDSLALSASEAYAAALIFYRAAKDAARMGTPGAKVVADELGRQFANRRNTSKPVPPPAPMPQTAVPHGGAQA
jgi:hypothetical protein